MKISHSCKHTESYVNPSRERSRWRTGRRAGPGRALLALLALMTVAALVLVGCGRRHTSTSKPTAARASASSTSPLRGKPRSPSELPTTSGAIYLANLEGQITELERLTREAPGLLGNMPRLGALHHTHGRILGEPDELALGIDTVSQCVRQEPGNARTYLIRAEQEQSLHRFAAARADLVRARALGLAAPDAVRASELETELDWNDGLYERAIAAIRKARRDRPSSHTWLREAQLDHDLGLSDASDAAFEAAEDLISDTSPLEVAHLNLQRGIQLMSRGRLEDACVFFREAVARLPAYVAPREHLAEALHELGRDEESRALYQAIVQASSDPEFMHALAQLDAAHGLLDEARELEARARRRYEELLKAYPEAMYWHASEFYLSAGDAEKALALLRANVELRPNSMSYTALARAELANGHGAEAKRAIDVALAMPLRSAVLFATASRVYRSAGDRAKADELRESARRANPRIDVDGP
jgi:tetratricopeptide (TPR) repeat protein